LIIVVGNCQATHIVNFLNMLPEVSTQYEVRHFRNYKNELNAGAGDDGAKQDRLPEVIKENKGRIVAFLRQTNHNWIGDPVTRDDLSAGCRFIEYPVCLLNYVWPLAVHDDRFDALSPEVARHFPYSICDSLLRDLVLQGVPEDEVVEAYMAHDITAMFKLDRLRRFNEIKLRDIDGMATFPMYDFINARFQDTQLFRTLNHPSGVLMAELLRRIVDHLPIITDLPVAAAALRTFEFGPGIQPYDAPVHPQIVKHFGLKWAEADRYQFWHEGSFSFEEHLIRLYHGRCNLTGYEGMKAYSARNLPLAQDLLEQTVADLPRSGYFRGILGELYLGLGRTDDAVAIMRESWALDPTVINGGKAVKVFNKARLFDEAERVVDQMAELHGAQVGVVLARASVLLGSARYREAVDLLEAASREDRDYRLFISLSVALAALKDLPAAIDAQDTAYRLSNLNPGVGKRLEALKARYTDTLAKTQR
jgi:hypothetical protein